MCEQEIINRIRELCDARGWTIYRLAKSCDITYSTLCTMLHKGTAPSIPTLVKLCQGFGITLSDFLTAQAPIQSFPQTKSHSCKFGIL